MPGRIVLDGVIASVFIRRRNSARFKSFGTRFSPVEECVHLKRGPSADAIDLSIGRRFVRLPNSRFTFIIENLHNN